jgi:nitrate/TMAO reductase-like tetraheme cytochrome c subunit
MNSDRPSGQHPRPGWFQNWVSMTGVVIAAGSLFAFILLFILDSGSRFANAYLGLLTYLVAPAFLVAGVVLVLGGAWFQRRRVLRGMGVVPQLQIDLARPRDRRILALFLTGASLFLLLTALGSYHTYHFTESVAFCGKTCHTVMAPEYTAYSHGAHARVSCTECHIGPGATWFVRAKLSGTYQVYATLADKYPRPVPTPVRNLRPAQDTCEQCHWPQQFVGNLDRTYSHFLNDETNTFHAVRMLLKVGGAAPNRGPVGGIHWHMSVANKIEYWPGDETRQKIPWVRQTDGQGRVTEYRAAGFTNAVPADQVRVMDCVDCHNRPAHRLESPNAAVNLSMLLGRIDTRLAYIKTNAVFALMQPYATEEEAMSKIAGQLRAKYPGQAAIEPAVAAVQEIYRNNFFPHMKASWRSYPDNLGHKDWPGCVRCHDDKHLSADGKKKIQFSDCSACHIILAQGQGAALDKLEAKGQPFVHPGEEYPEGFQCHECHTGGM